MEYLMLPWMKRKAFSNVIRHLIYPISKKIRVSFISHDSNLSYPIMLSPCCQPTKSKGECKIELIVSPKYHPEIAGEGVEYVWGFIKKYYRSLSMKDKK